MYDCVCMYVCMYVCIYACIRIHVHIRMHVSMHACMHAQLLSVCEDWYSAIVEPHDVSPRQHERYRLRNREFLRRRLMSKSPPWWSNCLRALSVFNRTTYRLITPKMQNLAFKLSLTPFDVICHFPVEAFCIACETETCPPSGGRRRRLSILERVLGVRRRRVIGNRNGRYNRRLILRHCGAVPEYCSPVDGCIRKRKMKGGWRRDGEKGRKGRSEAEERNKQQRLSIPRRRHEVPPHVGSQSNDVLWRPNRT